MFWNYKIEHISIIFDKPTNDVQMPLLGGKNKRRRALLLPEMNVRDGGRDGGRSFRAYRSADSNVRAASYGTFTT